MTCGPGLTPMAFYRIELPKGAHALSSLSSRVSGFDSQYELLLPRNAKFEVISVDSKGVYHLRMVVKK